MAVSHQERRKRRFEAGRAYIERVNEIPTRDEIADEICEKFEIQRGALKNAVREVRAVDAYREMMGD